MKQIFAAYLTEEVEPVSVVGEYDPEQELWIGADTVVGLTKGSDQGGSATSTWSCKVTVSATIFFDIGTDCDGDTVHDTD